MISPLSFSLKLMQMECVSNKTILSPNRDGRMLFDYLAEKHGVSDGHVFIIMNIYSQQ